MVKQLLSEMSQKCNFSADCDRGVGILANMLQCEIHELNADVFIKYKQDNSCR